VTLLAGREFNAADRVGTAKWPIVNEAFAKFNLGKDAIGKFMGRRGATR
jgi:hypothetical protein